MISINDYQEHYEYFLAEQELFEGLFKQSFNFVNESINVVSLNEGFKETIINYISKITAALEKAWERFKEIITRGADVAYLKAVKPRLANADPKFIIKNHILYDTRPLDNIKIVPFNYEEMKESLGTKKDFLEKYYSSILRDPEKSVSENVESLAIKSIGDIQCTGEMLRDIHDLLSNHYSVILKALEADLKSVNVSNSNIQRLVSSIPDSQVQSEAISIYEQYIIEADEKKSVEFVDTGENDGNKGTLVKAVTNYLSGSTDIISAKMKIYRDMYAQDMKILKHYIKPKDVDEFEDQEKQSEEKVTVKSQIKI